jgi:hypothetical protein
LSNIAKEVVRYTGSNAILNAVYDEETDGTLWMVQGVIGRLPILADSREAAVEEYVRRFRATEDSSALVSDMQVA